MFLYFLMLPLGMHPKTHVGGIWFSCPGLVSLSSVLQVPHFLQENCPVDLLCCFEEQSLKLPVWITDIPDIFSIESAAS